MSDEAQTHPSFRHTDHRPWPLPQGRWRWRQAWCDLLFAHWPIPPEALRPLVPAGLEVQTFDGVSWVGVVPFRMEGVAPRPLPDVPGISAFPELNVRLYVEAEGKPGVWFLSLDATNPIAVATARLLFHLPYYRAEIDITSEGDGFRYRSRRAGVDGPVFAADYRPISDVYQTTPGLEQFLIERYCLYAQAPDGALYRTEVHHAPWPVQRASAEVTANTMLQPHGLALDGPPALLHFARRIEVVVWPPARVG